MTILLAALMSQTRVRLPLLWVLVACNSDGTQEEYQDGGGPVADNVLRLMLALGWSLEHTLELIFDERPCSMLEAAIVARVLHMPLRVLLGLATDDEHRRFTGGDHEPFTPA